MNGSAAAGSSSQGHLRRRRHVHRRRRRRRRRPAGDRQGADHAAAAWSTGCAPAIERRRAASSASSVASCSPARDLFVYAHHAGDQRDPRGHAPRAPRCSAPRASRTCSSAARAARCIPTTSRRPYPEPYVPRRLTFEIPERIGAEGDVVDRARRGRGARAIVAGLRDRGVEAVAVCLLWSIANPEHEVRLGRADRGGAARRPVHPLAPAQPDHARVPPRLGRRDRRLAEAADAGAICARSRRSCATPASPASWSRPRRRRRDADRGPGRAPADLRAPAPARRWRRSPAAPTPSASSTARTSIVCDTGGTSFDVSLVRDGGVVFTRETWLGAPFAGHLTGLSSVDVRIDRRRRRLDRLGRARRPAARRPGERRAPSPARRATGAAASGRP